MPTTPKTCDTCRHFVPGVHDSGECHRYAPSPVVEAARHHPDYQPPLCFTHWPLVGVEDFCAEYSAGLQGDPAACGNRFLNGVWQDA